MKKIITSKKKELQQMKENLYINFSKWDNQNNILFITGLSGSGKSTLAKKLCEQYGAEYNELDMLTHRIGKPDKFTNKVKTGKITNSILLDYITNELKNKQFTHGNWGTYDKDRLHENFIKYALKKVYGNGKLYIIEGSHFYIENMNIDTTLLLGQPIIIKTTNPIIALFRRIKRRILKKQPFKEKIMDFIKYDCKITHFTEYKELKKFITKIMKVNNNKEENENKDTY